MAGQRILIPLTKVRIFPREPAKANDDNAASVGSSVGDPVLAALEAGLDQARAARRWTDVARLAHELADRTAALEAVVDIAAKRARR